MHARTSAAATALLVATLTACGDSDDSEGPMTKPPRASSPKATGSEAATEKALKLGTPARTVGDQGTGILEITPDTIVYVTKGSGETSANGVFAVVTMKDKAMTAVAADEPAPISGGGWSWIAPDGESIGFDSGNSTNVVMDKYNNADPVQPGTYQWRAQVFDLTKAQAKGGTLLYTDGEGTAYRWRMPSTDSGPRVAEVKQQLEF